MITWINHTCFVVEEIERSLAFYRDLLGMTVERDTLLEGPEIARAWGLKDTRYRLVYLGIGDNRHALELMQFHQPLSRQAKRSLTDIGTVHLGCIVNDLGKMYRELSAKGVKFTCPPIYRGERPYPLSRKVAIMLDPDGNLVELIERAPAPAQAQDGGGNPVSLPGGYRDAP